jgi:hypothetical protein
LSHSRGGRGRQHLGQAGQLQRRRHRHAEAALDGVGPQFAHARQRARQLAQDARSRIRPSAVIVAFDEGVALFHHVHLARRVQQLADLVHRQRVGADAQHVEAGQLRLAQRLDQVVPGDAADQDARPAGAADLQPVHRMRLAPRLQRRLLVHQAA